MTEEKAEPAFSTLIIAPWLNPELYNQHLTQKFQQLRQERGWTHIESDSFKGRAFPDRFDLESTFAISQDEERAFLASLRLTSMANRDFPFHQQLEETGLISTPAFSRLNHFMLSDLILMPEAKALAGINTRTRRLIKVLPSLLADSVHYLRTREDVDMIWYSAELQHELPEFLKLGLQILSSPYPIAKEIHVLMAALVNDQNRLQAVDSPLCDANAQKTLFIHELAGKEMLARAHLRLMPEALKRRASLSKN